MNGYKEFMCLFGGVTILDVGQFLLAAGFIVVIGMKISKFLIDFHDTERSRIEKLDKAYGAAMKLPDYRKQSLEIQESFIEKIENLCARQDDIIKRIEKMEEDSRKREVNKIRGKLIQSYHYYTNPDRNPSKSWTRMEAEAFWATFADYEELGGNGYVHSVIQPTMEALEIIEN